METHKYPKKYTEKSFILLLIDAKKTDISNLKPKYKELIIDIRSNFKAEILEFQNLKEGSELEFYYKHKAKFERFLNQ